MLNQREFAEEVARALAHLFDLAFLETSPLAELAERARPGAGSRAKLLRKAILDAIEALRPPEGTPADAPAWRPYRILEGRYVAHIERQELQMELVLGKSQYYRDHSRAVEALACILWHAWGLDQALSEAEQPCPPTDADTLTRDELLALARQEAPEALELNAVLRDLATLLGPSLQESGLRLELAPSTTPLWVRAIPSILRQSVLLPLSELAGALMEGAVRVQVVSQREQALVRISCEGPLNPTAPPLDPERVRPFVEMSGGAIILDQEGARQICLSFPVLARQRLVLLVDNNQELAELFARYLEGEDWLLLHAATVEQALVLCQERRPSLILLDVLLPGQDGWQLLTQLKRSPATASIPVVICSILHQPQLALSLGAAGYLRKPVTQEMLREALHRWG
jgi:CheY-like chemotaxis protein